MIATYELAHIWKVVEPAVPDTIEQVAANVYEARWWKPAPKQEILAFLREPQIRVIGEPFEPHHLPSGIAVRFTVSS
ncbi:MAG: hypothetical protein IPK19_14175 [Chloroflexi bacterium]|nr:hypothetical protein [Chloroflexota bacterium]